MQFTLDNLLAALIGAVIFLILVTVTHRHRQASIEVTNFYALRKQELAFIEVLKRDLENVTEVKSIQPSATDSSFSFHAYVDTTHTTLRKITYRQTRVGRRGGEDLFQVLRYETPLPSGTAVHVGSSMATLTGWSILARNEDGDLVTDPANARQVAVAFAAASPHGGSSIALLDHVRWEAVFRPPMIQRNITL